MKHYAATVTLDSGLLSVYNIHSEIKNPALVREIVLKDVGDTGFVCFVLSSDSPISITDWRHMIAVKVTIKADGTYDITKSGLVGSSFKS